jgi:hypothetical protein
LPRCFQGSILVITSPAFEGACQRQTIRLRPGIVSGSTPPLLREKFVVPAPVLTIPDSRVKYLLILRLALARRTSRISAPPTRAPCWR